MTKIKFFTLRISKIDNEYAELENISSYERDGDGVFNTLGVYTSHDHYYTPDEVKIYTGFDSDGIEYKISKINDCAFSNCRDLINLIIGPYVSRIGWNMYQCTSLMNIKVDSANPTYHDIDGVLFKGHELMAFPHARTGHYDVPYGTVKIGRMAFKSCLLSSISFPETLTEIGINSFYRCRNIKEFILPKSIKKVYSNCDINFKPISQVFYLSDDINKLHPFSITEIIKMFPA